MVILLWINDSVVLLRMYSFGYPVDEHCKCWAEEDGEEYK
jgi:hypothetical protein